MLISRRQVHNGKFRNYRGADYAACEALTGSAWEFDKNFRPEKLAKLVGYIYTAGALSGSNFRRVVEVDGKVSGFIFGLNKNEPVPEHKLQKLPAKLMILMRLMFIRGMRYSKKAFLIKAMSTHEVNRNKLVSRDNSEIMLFVIDPAFQGSGFGTKLFGDFVEFCRSSGVQTIIVETNRVGASSFYERIGFETIGDFHSPLHAYATPDGQACMLKYSCN